MFCESPPPAVKNLWDLVMMMCVLADAECMAHFVFVAPGMCTGPLFLQAALLGSSKAGMASRAHRSAWPGRCASAGGGSGR